jgi:hypothetical protein
MSTSLMKPWLSARRAALLLLPVALAGTMIWATPVTAQAPDAGPVPAATLTEVNVPGTSPMSATAVDLEAAGYTAREFYAEGLANRYSGAIANTFTTATVLDRGNPYRTRVMVRYPEPNDFNGTLAVEWTNVTIGVDFEFAAAEASEYLLREGYAVAVVSAQRVGVERLKTWSPARYAGLSVDTNRCGASGTELCTGDPLSYDILAQVTTALRKNRGGEDAPMPGLRVKDTIAIGQSQSAGRLAVYYNTIQPLHDVFDGFAFWDRSGQLRGDLAVPAISVNSEGLGGAFGGAGWTTSKYTRKWDVAGSTHASLYGARYIEAIARRDRSILTPTGQPTTFFGWIEPSCVELPPFTTVDVGLVYNKAIASVRSWIRTGRSAAPSSSFEVSATGTVLRNAEGKVKGGLRLPQFVVPTADQGAINGTAFPCAVSGWHRNYTRKELKAMYGSHDRYVSKVARVMSRLVAERYVLAEDASAAVRRAVRSDVAK